MADGAEHPMEYHEIYLQYTTLLERQVETFMAENGVTIEDIMDAARHAPPGVHTCIDYLLASSEYLAFLQLMDDFFCMSQFDCDAPVE